MLSKTNNAPSFTSHAADGVDDVRWFELVEECFIFLRNNYCYAVKIVYEINYYYRRYIMSRLYTRMSNTTI